MNKKLIGYIIATALCWCFFGWKAMLFAAFFGLFAWFAPSETTMPPSDVYPFFLWDDSDKSQNE